MNFSKFPNKMFFGLSLVGSLTLFGCQDSVQKDVLNEMQQDSKNPNLIDNQFIVVLKKGTFSQKLGKVVNLPNSRENNLKEYEQRQEIMRSAVNDMVNTYGISPNAIEFVYDDAVLGFSGKFTKEQISALSTDSRVEYVEQDQLMFISDGDGGKPFFAKTEAQTVPWGISRVGYGNYAGGSRWAWVIDSGIDASHPDLTVDSQYSRSFVSGYSATQDGNGHGTHVSGTIAAKNDNNGVVGVAAGATLVACRVFAGSNGSNSAVISAVNYVGSTAYSQDVANMSLGGGASTTLDNAVKSAANKGIYFAVAAGNEAQNANNVSPARANGTNIRTVSAMDVNSRYASFSNYANPPIDICAPGVNIQSTWPGNRYNTISGTSMATPHVAGILLINGGTINTQGNVLNDPDGNADPIAKK